MRAKNEYEAARDALMQYCEKATDYVCEVKESAYPLKVVFTPNDAQAAMFPTGKNSGVLEITVGLDTNVSSTLNFKMDSELLKKLIKNAQKIAFLYYHAFREQFDDLTACEIQILPQKDHDDKQTE
jgi:hypothetical protein